MARIRSVHPGQWTDEDFVQMSPMARLLTLAIRNEADDRGVFEWKPVTIKMRLIPVDNVDVDGLLAEMETHDQVRRFESAGKQYGVIRNFSKFQRPKSPSYTFPPPPDFSNDAASPELISEIEPDEDASFPPDAETAPQMKEEGGSRKREANASVVCDDAQSAIAAFNDVAAKVGLPKAQVLNDQRRKQIARRLHECGGLDGWSAALAKLEASDWCCGRAARSDGWRADLDFLLQPKSFTRLMEGFYDNRSSGGKAPNPGRYDPDRLKAGAAAFMAHDMAGGSDPAGYG